MVSLQKVERGIYEVMRGRVIVLGISPFSTWTLSWDVFVNNFCYNVS